MFKNCVLVSQENVKLWNADLEQSICNEYTFQTTYFIYHFYIAWKVEHISTKFKTAYKAIIRNLRYFLTIKTMHKYLET